LDDLLIYSDSAEEHLVHLERVLKKLGNSILFAKWKKCQFNQSELKFLGFLVGHGQLKTDPAKIQSISEWPKPKSKSDLRKFMGLTNYFRRFI
jgi:hypothetical protein